MVSEILLLFVFDLVLIHTSIRINIPNICIRISVSKLQNHLWFII